MEYEQTVQTLRNWDTLFFTSTFQHHCGWRYIRWHYHF
jgi:hypothetical protein